MTTATTRADLSVIKARQQKTWASGDYAVIASRIVLASELLADAADLQAGWEVLDVACGNGNATLAAARSGTHATGIDYVPELLEGGRERAVAEGLDVEFRLGDTEDLPVPDGYFDAVLSVFGVMFAPDHQLAADEIIRASRPGGTVGLASWTPDGFIGQMFDVITRHVPGPASVASPLLWGTERHLSSLFGAVVADVRSVQRTCTWRFTSRGVRLVLPPLVRAGSKGIRGTRRGRPRRAGPRPSAAGPALGPEPRRQHRRPRDLPGNHPHSPLTHLGPVRIIGHHHDRGARGPGRAAGVQPTGSPRPAQVQRPDIGRGHAVR
jgi:SAM-dependent methyltransferase